MSISLFDDPEKDKKWKDRLLLVFFCIAAFFIWIIFSPSGTTPTEKAPVQSSLPKLTETEYKKSAQSTDYESLARYANKYKGMIMAVTGEISQVQDTSSGYVIRLATKKQSYGDGYMGDDVWITLGKQTAKPLEKDIVKVYGLCTGEHEYDTVLGSSKTIPAIEGKYIDHIGRD